MFYDALANSHGLKHDPFKALVVPRPIGWVTSLDAQGRVNLAPYSFFNAFASPPQIVGFSSTERKHSVSNIEATGEFVCNLATWELRDEVNATSAAVDAGVDEMEFAGLEAAASRMVKPPRVAASPVALECRYLKTVTFTTLDGVDSGSLLVAGQVVGVHIDDALVGDGLVDISKARPISRLGYRDYAAVDELFQMTRPSV